MYADHEDFTAEAIQPKVQAEPAYIVLYRSRANTTKRALGTFNLFEARRLVTSKYPRTGQIQTAAHLLSTRLW